MGTRGGSMDPGSLKMKEDETKKMLQEVLKVLYLWFWVDNEDEGP